MFVAVFVIVPEPTFPQRLAGRCTQFRVRFHSHPAPWGWRKSPFAQVGGFTEIDGEARSHSDRLCWYRTAPKSRNSRTTFLSTHNPNASLLSSECPYLIAAYAIGHAFSALAIVMIMRHSARLSKQR